jgi:hypothetical protein
MFSFDFSSLFLFLDHFGILNQKSWMDYYFIFITTIPTSILAYLIFDRYKLKIMIDLGNHKWIVRNK